MQCSDATVTPKLARSVATPMSSRSARQGRFAGDSRCSTSAPSSQPHRSPQAQHHAAHHQLRPAAALSQHQQPTSTRPDSSPCGVPATVSCARHREQQFRIMTSIVSLPVEKFSFTDKQSPTDWQHDESPGLVLNYSPPHFKVMRGRKELVQLHLTYESSSELVRSH